MGVEDVHVRGDEEVGGGGDGWKWLAHNSNYSSFVIYFFHGSTYKCRSVYCSTTEITLRQDMCRFD